MLWQFKAGPSCPYQTLNNFLSRFCVHTHNPHGPCAFCRLSTLPAPRPVSPSHPAISIKHTQFIQAGVTHTKEAIVRRVTRGAVARRIKATLDISMAINRQRGPGFRGKI